MEIHTTVAEPYCNRVFQVQGQLFQEMRIRGPAGWDWPFSLAWRFPNVQTLKLELKDLYLLPRHTPHRTVHFHPDPNTTEGSNALLTRSAVLRLVCQVCRTPNLRDVSILGVPKLRSLLHLEIALLDHIFVDLGRYIQRHEKAVRYLLLRPGGWWDTQTARSRLYWSEAKDFIRKGDEGVYPLGFFANDGPCADVFRYQLALWLFMRMRAAKHEPIGPPTTKAASILWS